MEPDYQRLIDDLMDFYGTAKESGFPMAVMELGEIEQAIRQADEAGLIRLAREAGFNLANYGIDEYEQER